MQMPFFAARSLTKYSSPEMVAVAQHSGSFAFKDSEGSMALNHQSAVACLIV